MDTKQGLSDLSPNSPGLEPPPGVVSDFAHPGGQHESIYAVLIVCAALSTICMATRGYARWTSRLFRLQDALFLLSWIMYNAFIYVLYDFAIYPGFAVHQWNVPLINLGRLNKLIWIGSTFYALEMALIKSAILLDWIQFFSPAGQKTTTVKLIHCWIWTNVAFYLVVTFAIMFQCLPTRKIWDPFFVGGKCVFSVGMEKFVSGVLNLISDAIILVLPQKVIWGLQMSRRKKIGVSLLFAVGVFACIAAAIRLYYSYQMAVSPDQLYTASVVGFWAMAELTAGFLVVGLPAVPKAVKALTGAKSMRFIPENVRGISPRHRISDSNHDHYFQQRRPAHGKLKRTNTQDPEGHGYWYGSGDQELRTISKAVRISITTEPKLSEPPTTPSYW